MDGMKGEAVIERVMFGGSSEGIQLVKDGPSFWVRIFGTLCVKIEPHTGCIYWHPGGPSEPDMLLGKLETSVRLVDYAIAGMSED